MENRDWELFRGEDIDNTPLSSSPMPDRSAEANMTDTEPNEGGGGGEGGVQFKPDEDIYPSFGSKDFLPEKPEEAEPKESGTDRERFESDVDIFANVELENFIPENPEEAEEPDADREQPEADSAHFGSENRDTIHVAPVYFAKDNAHAGKRVKKKHTAIKVIGLTFAAILIIAACEILSGFDISLKTSSIGIEIVLRDKSTNDSLWSGGGMPPTVTEDNGPIPPGEGTEEEVEAEAEAAKVPIYPAGDGTTLEVSQIIGDKYTLQEIYGECIESIVLVNVELEGGYGSGTGIIMSKDGYIITNEHVIDGAASIDIELQDGTAYSAALVGKDSQTDLAVLKIEAINLLPASFGDSSGLKVGDEVAAIGNPLGLNFSLSNGIISALDRDVEVNGYYMTMIQTNVALNEGNSGGALINMYGQVIGITNMKLVSYSAYSSIEGMAFAIPTNVVKPIVDSIIEMGYVSGRPALGIMCATLDAAAAESEGLPQGVYVSSIYKESSAYGKLETGDVITAANGVEVLSNQDLNEIKNGLGVGDTLTLTVFRDGETFDVDITLIEAALIEY